MSLDSAVAIAWDVLKGVVDPIKRHFGYVMSSKSCADDLQEEVKKLEHEAERLHNAAEVASNNLRSVYSRATELQASAEEALEEARDLLGNFEKASKTCCHGTLPNPNCRYQFSRKAKVKIERIKRLAGNCRELHDISFSGPAPGNVATPTPARGEDKDVVKSTTATVSASSASTSIKLWDDGVFESRASMIRDIMNALSDNRYNVVGVYGMGGVGKSTLLVDAEKRLREEHSFDWVAKADVSEHQDIKRIQGEIAHAFGLNDIENKDYVNVRAKLLHERLEKEEMRKKKVLIILDNLWEGLDLKSVGIPCGHDNQVIGCKLLLTARDRNVLLRDMWCDKDFHLDRLNEEEAKGLFEGKVGDKVNDDEFKPLVAEALHKCAGLPFLIVAMAKHFKHAGLSEWKDTLKQIKISKNEGIGEVVNKMLQLSYNHLKGEEVKSLLRLCVVYGVSKPSLENLVRYGMGLRLVGEDSSMEEARNRLSSLISTLQASSLLLDNEDADSFKIHDLVREFVDLVASRDYPILVLKDKDKSVTELPKDKRKSCRAICFPYVDMEELPKELDCPELQIFLLFTNNGSLHVPDSLFNSMRKLTVLNFTGIRLTHLPSSFQFLESLQTLCLDDCWLEDVAILGELKGLRILSFVNSKIQQLPKEIGQLVELRLLDLNNCSLLQIIEPGVLRRLIKLEELYMENSFDQWNVVEQTPPTNASLVELNNMKNLCTLHVSIPDPSGLPEDLNIKKLTKYRIQIGNAHRESRMNKGLRTLMLELNPMSDILQKECIRIALHQTDDLFLNGSNGIELSICELSPEGFPKLKHLHVKNNPSVHYILRQHFLTAFNALESLLLENLINLEKICHSRISFKSFTKLKVVQVESCDKMEILFPLSLMRKLPELEEIRVVKCDLMGEIVKADECGKVELHNLHVLELSDMPNIKNFLSVGTTPSSSTSNDQVGTPVAFFNEQEVSIPSLKSLTMTGLPHLKYIWNDESSLGLTNLESLRVQECQSLSKVISSESLVKLHKLHTLSISYCGSVEEIFDLDEPSVGGNVETLSKLTDINIDGLLSLKQIWNKNPCGIVRFQNLKHLHVSGCPNLVFMFFPSMVKSLSQLSSIYIWDCKKMEAIIMEEKRLGMETSEALAFPKLTFLRFIPAIQTVTFFLSNGKRMAGSQENWSQDGVKSLPIALFNREVAFPSLETLHINGMDKIEMIWDNKVVVDSFHNLNSIRVCGCNKLVNIVPSCILGQLWNLEYLMVGWCDSLEVVFELQPLNSLDGRPIARFPLKKLEIYGIPELKCVWDKELHRLVKFQCLLYVNVSSCKSLSSLFSASIARDLMQLEELTINECGIVELIENEVLVPRFVFPNLTSLKLEDLTELKCIYAGAHALDWRALRTLEVHGCKKVELFASLPNNKMPLDKQPLFPIEKGAFPNLEELKLDISEQMEIWHGHFHNEEFLCKLRILELRHISKKSAISTCHFVESLTNLEELVVCKSYLEEPSINVEAIDGPSDELKVILPFSRHSQHLKTLDVSHCDGLPNMFTPTIIGNLVALTKLRISNCKMLTEVVSNEGGKEGHVVAFSQLKYMELDGLIGLRCFSSGGYTLMFPLLEDVTVTRCLNMKFFSDGQIEAPKLERVQVCSNKSYASTTWFWKENLNITIRDMFEEMVAFAGLKFMRLSEFPKLIGKWHSEFIPIKSSWQLESLVVDKCQSFINCISSRLMLVLDNMSILQVRDCESLEEIFDLEVLYAAESTRVLPRLWHLELVNLPKLRRLWNKDRQGMMCFESLDFLTIYNCSNLRHAFTPSMAQCFTNLYHMKIKECDHMEGVIAEEEGQGSTVKKIILSIDRMTLECLPNLTSFLSGKNHMLDCPELRSLTIAHCPKMRSLTWQPLVEIDHCTPSFFTPQVKFPQLELMVLSHMDNLSKIWTNSPQGTLTCKHLRKVEVQNCKSLKNLFPHWVARSLSQLEELRVESCWLEEIVASGDDTPHSTTSQVLFPNLTSLVLHDMPKLKSFYPNLPPLNWTFLKELRVTHCDKLNMLSFAASKNKWTQRNDQQDLSDQEAHSLFEGDFPNLERLLLVDKYIQMIRDGNFPDDIFGKPKALTLACFHDEKAIFPSIFLLERFQNLQSLEVFCSSFEDIFPNEGLVDEGKHSVLENLRELKLSKLHNLKRVWREDYLVSKILKSIKTLEVWDCPSLMTLFPTMTSFQNLKKLVVKNSSGLIHLVALSTINNLMNLTKMTIIGCERMKEVVTNDENGEGKVISLEKLGRLRLKHLPSLVCFSSTTGCSFRFPSLWNITVKECPKMKIFSEGTVSTPNLHYASLFRYSCAMRLEGDLNTAIQKLSA